MSSAIVELLGDKLVSKSGEISTADAIKGKDAIGLYFSAHWCGPCRQFTPLLTKQYSEWIAGNSSVELIFVSSDEDEDAFKEYFATMDFKALPFDEDKKDALSEKFGVQGIPTLIVLDKDGKIISKDGRADVNKHKAETGKYWEGLAKQ